MKTLLASMPSKLVLSLVALLGLAAQRPAARAADRPAGFAYSPLANDSLQGWHVTGCQVEVTGGVLKLVGGDGLVRSDLEYADFIFEVEWRPLKASDWDSGIYFRSELPADGTPWPSRYQCNLKQGYEGNVNPLAGAKSSGLVKPGEWNRFVLTAVGSRATLDINGKRAWEADGIEPAAGYLGFQAEVPLGGQFEFRNLKVTELGYRSLFNGRDLVGWTGGNNVDAAKCWRVDDSEILCTGQEGPWLRSNEQYGDFDLRLEYKVQAGGNSGVYVRVPEGGGHRGVEIDGAPGGVEVQILDDADERYKDIAPYQFAASVYAVAPATRHVARPAGEWNTLEIETRGSRYRVVHNGVTVVDADDKEFPELARRLQRGFLGLQNHSEPVRFRNLRIRTDKE